jgi:UDP-2,3-diacylglucosamine pyrophosphatase LpxH
MNPAAMRLRTPTSVRSIFVSDIHLGCKHSRANLFLSFLETYRPKNLFIVGDFIDGRKLRRTWRWDPTYNRILQRLVEMSRRGTRLFYTPGNHDAFLRHFLYNLGPVQIADEFVHRTADGRRFLITHGDQFDRIETGASWLSVLASAAYDLLLSADAVLNRLRGAPQHATYALSAAVKHRVKKCVAFISDFEERLARHARSVACDGVICGHIHTPAIIDRGDITYCNTGDWVEHSTALVESDSGKLEILHYVPGQETVATFDACWPIGSANGFGDDEPLAPVSPVTSDALVA